MKTILILSSGKVYTFWVRKLAVQYQLAYGGTLIAEDLQQADLPQATTV